MRQNNGSSIKDAGSQICVWFADWLLRPSTPETRLCHLELFTCCGVCALEAHGIGYRIVPGALPSR